MNRNLSKLLQSLAGVVLMSLASFSMAATYDYDFDADENERGGQPLNFGDLNVYGARLIDNGQRPEIGRAYPYLDSGNKAGLGVCGELLAQQQGTNWCNPSSDDNMQTNEVLGFVFDSEKKISDVGINGAHTDLADGTKIMIWSDTNGFQLLSMLAGKISLDFNLTEMAIFGPLGGWYANQFKWGQGTTANQLYVAGINEVPIPAAAWLFGSALLGLTGLRRRKVAV